MKKFEFSSLMRTLRTIAMLAFAGMLTLACSSGDDGDDSEVNPTGNQEDNTPIISDITYELSPSSVVVPKATCEGVTNADTVNHKLTLPAGGITPVEGQCLIFNTPTKQLPYGLLAKVTGVSESNGGYVVTYEDAELKDAFKDIEIPEQAIPLGDYVEHIYDMNGNEVSFTKSVSTRASGKKNLTIAIPEISWPIGEGFELTPKMSMDLTMKYLMSFADYELHYASMRVDADVTVGADLSFKVEEASLVSIEQPLVQITMGAIPVGPVVLTPSVELTGVFSVDGKISLEASISYKRTVHANMTYQASAGLTGDIKLDPEAPDALQYSFGPKFEGGYSYGLIASSMLGVYHKTLALRANVKTVKKETMSGKFDLAAFKGTSTDYLLSASPFQLLSNLTTNASCWNYARFEDIMYNQAYGVTLGMDLLTLGTKAAKGELPEMSFPISSTPICPQVTYSEKDFFKVNDKNEVTLTMHLPAASVLDDLTEYRAEWKRKGAPSSESPIVSYFNFDDDKRAELKNMKKDDDITTTAIAQLKEGESYVLSVYMNVLNIDIPIFVEQYVAKEIKSVDAYIHFFGQGDDGKEWESHNTFFPTIFNTSQQGNRLFVEGTSNSKETNLYFEIDDINKIEDQTAKIENIKFNGTSSWDQMNEETGEWMPTSRRRFDGVVKSVIPMTKANYWSLNGTAVEMESYTELLRLWSYPEGFGEDPEIKEVNITGSVPNEKSYIRIEIKWK